MSHISKERTIMSPINKAGAEIWVLLYGYSASV